MQPFFKMDKMTRVEANAKKWITHFGHYGIKDRATFNANANGFIPCDSGSKIRRHQLLHIVANALGQIILIPRQKSGTALER